MASTVMGRPEEGLIHRLAKNAAPAAISGLEEHLAKPKSRIVAVERHDIDWRDGRKQNWERFLWIKARYNVTVAQVIKSYREHYDSVDEQPTLRVNKQEPNNRTTLEDLNFHNDQYVVFTTKTAADVAPPASPSPSAPEVGRALHTSPPGPFNHDTSLFTSEVTPFDSLRDAAKQEGQALSFLAPVTADQAMFVQQNDQSDTPDPVEGLDMQSRMADFGMPEQDALPYAGTATSSALAIRRPSDIMPEQPGQDDVDARMTPVRAVDPNSSSSAYVPRMAPNPFGVDELAESQPVSTHTSLQRLLQEDSSPERLEAAVVKGAAVLSEIEGSLLSVQRDPDVQKWLQQIQMVRDLDKSSRTVIGVVGNTGAGKSSVINALLDEERLVPTNCMRACTAVVTEISYNDVNIESARYRAEIEFIKPEDWRRELAVLFDEVFDAKGNISQDAHNPDSIAGVACAKIRAVYHRHTTDMLRKSSVEQLMDVPSVSGILGTVKRIQSRDCASFYQRLQHYVDSQQKSNGGKGAKAARQLQLWPLIKVVRIYTKADVLSTGAVIADLPGVHDSNAARAAVAESYIKECTGLWIVAPITRAVDDKAAKNLLGTTFKCQLKYDGTYGAVTFICSKTDDISKTEAVDALQLGDAIADHEAERMRIDEQKAALKHKKRDLQTKRDTQNDFVEQYEDQIAQWEELLSTMEDEELNDAMETPTKKRKRMIDHEPIEPDDQPLTSQQLQSKIDEHKLLKRTARQHGTQLRDDITRLQKSLNELEERRVELEQEAEALCVKGRNDWSRGRIREDFAEGVKELDQENAAEENPDDFEPDEEIRDYAEVARSLPVFCVSSRAYQKLSGRLQKDSDVNGFSSLNQTEIPQLQAHCRKLTEASREEVCKNFLNSLSRLLTSLTLWASDDGSNSESSTQQRMIMQTFVTKNSQTLERQLAEAVSNTMEDVKETLERQLFGFLAAAAETAARKALLTSDTWGAPRDQGGLFWATYKATVRRHGVFHGASGNRDFSKDLTAPMIKELMNCWEKTFQRRLPEIFKGFPVIVNTTIKDFHNAIEQKCISQSLWISRVARLSDNIVVLESAFNDLAKQTMGNINEAQREINREFTPSVAAAMAIAYDQCSEENGRGSFARMKQIMHDHVSLCQDSMFQNATQGIRDQLDLMCKQCRNTLGGRVQRMYEAISRDYLALIGTDAGKERVAGKPEKIARKKVDEVISQSEAVFSEVLSWDAEQLKSMGMGIGGKVVGVDSEADVEDATEPLIVLESDGVDDDDMVDLDE